MSPEAAPPPPPVEPDTKDWTWAVTQPCPDCGFDGSSVGRADVPGLVRSYSARMIDALARPDAATRPAPTTWSVLEYGCHVRDVCRIFAERLQLMLDEDDPRFANWDQDVTAVEDRYWSQQPSTVAADLGAESDRLADAFAGVHGEQWNRPGRRSNGSLFTVESLGVYLLHDLAHHADDVSETKSHTDA